MAPIPVMPLADGRIGITLDAEDMLDAFLARFGARLKQIQIDEPSLATVFLALTGREIDQRTPGAPKKAARAQ